ncbi:FHA domain-containing protein DDL isoform X2 [Medicago truncatula]|uniref:FHA domain-containing protein DDL isoform X2 n=1 Tax=Medicago truncatula TaxID=3880 RepID=UPI000D2F4101|nr:FHA domain-containing protein DDL isoform X2 [Medicago truncatula]
MRGTVTVTAEGGIRRGKNLTGRRGGEWIMMMIVEGTADHLGRSMIGRRSTVTTEGADIGLSRRSVTQCLVMRCLGKNSREAEMMNEEDDSLMKMKAAEEALQEKQKVKPSFELSGKLAEETNRVRGITLLFNEPPEARKPDVKWRLYVFKTGEMLNEPLYIHRQSCYLFGRERRVADVPTDHPSCSKQHAVIQFRQVEKEQPDGMIVKQTRPYIMDLGSTNKTFVNDSPIEPQRYYELREQDTIKFGNSSREYVLLHENSASAS